MISVASVRLSAKVTLITGVTGQDRAHLARLLLQIGYLVHGIKRRSSSFNTGRVDELYADPHEAVTSFFMQNPVGLPGQERCCTPLPWNRAGRIAGRVCGRFSGEIQRNIDAIGIDTEHR